MTQRKRGRAAVTDRARVMNRDAGICQACQAQGRITPATVVDHIIALVNGGDDTDANKQALCDVCHANKTDIDLGRKQRVKFNEDGTVIW